MTPSDAAKEETLVRRWTIQACDECGWTILDEDHVRSDVDDAVGGDCEHYIAAARAALLAALTDPTAVGKSADDPSEPASDLDPTEEAQAETIHSLAIRFTEQEAELHRLREAGEAISSAVGTWLAETSPGMHINSAVGRGRTKKALRTLRAVLQARSEGKES